MRIALALAALLILPGCVPSYITIRHNGDAPDYSERRGAYRECVGDDDDKVEVRIACTVVVYGG